jgi:sterol desaturase/sphingolipid hydroxylase (fatty acid hydroxylase superfamily)
MKLHPGKNIRLFENSVLEKLTYVHPAAPIALWGPVVAGCMYYGWTRLTGISLLAWILAGLAAWTLAEYMLHKHVFHFKPNGPFQERIAYLIHGIHHDDPADQRRLLMPPAAAFIIAAVFYAAFCALFGFEKAQPFFAGFICGYLAYDYIHFATHYLKPKAGVLLWLKQYHLKHHFVSPSKRYGVSNPFWDLVFRTQR